MSRIGLCMIVKNEAHVILDCLRSVRPIIDHVVIEDTGSTDGTQDIIRKWLKAEHLPGEVFDAPWQDFATNRTKAFERLRQYRNVDYAFVMDADDLLILPQPFDPKAFRARLTDDHYFVPILSNGNRYWRIQIVRNSMPYFYRGVLHEFIETPTGARQGTIDDISIRHGIHGGRSLNPNKYRDDALTFERALETERDPFLVSRYTFYLGQSWKDANAPERAIPAYLRRAEMGYWEDERYISLLQAGRLSEGLDRPVEEILAIYARAQDIVPKRIEALHAAARFCRIKGLNARGYDIVARHDLDGFGHDGLFVEQWMYDYGLRDEHAINAYWAGHYRECLDLSLKVLASPSLPATERERVKNNAQAAANKLTEEVRPADLRLYPDGPGTPVLKAAAAPAIHRGVVDGRVSLITPTRNRLGFLRALRRYVLAQNVSDIEWLILDDSPEPPVLDPAFDSARIHYEHHDGKLSIGEKRNRLIDRACGEVIMQFDDDDYYAPNYVPTMLTALQGADLVNLRGWFLYDLRWEFFGYWTLEHKVGPHFRCDANGVQLMVFDRKMTEALTDNHMGYGFSYAFRRSVWERVKFPDIDWSEDSAFAKAAAEQFRFIGLNDRSGLCLHYLHPASTSICFPQYQIPTFMIGKMFPDARNAPEPAIPVDRELVAAG